MKFADFLKSARKEIGISQEELAFRLSINKYSMHKYENELTFPKIDDVERMADKMGYEIVYVKKEQ